MKVFAICVINATVNLQVQAVLGSTKSRYMKVFVFPVMNVITKNLQIVLDSRNIKNLFIKAFAILAINVIIRQLKELFFTSTYRKFTM